MALFTAFVACHILKTTIKPALRLVDKGRSMGSIVRSWSLMVVVIVHGRDFVLRMPVLAVQTLRTEAGQVVLTHHFSYVLVVTIRSFLIEERANDVSNEPFPLRLVHTHNSIHSLTMFTETACIPRAFFLLALWVNVKIHAFVAVAALAILGVKPAFRHFLHVENVQEFTAIAFLAQTTKPMFAYNGLVTLPTSRVFEWTIRSFVTDTLQVVFADLLYRYLVSDPG